MNVTAHQSMPASARLLGWSGVIPFAACAVALWLPQAAPWEVDILRGMTAYAAVILSFLGGVRWGAALGADGPDGIDTDLVLAVIPSLLAWCALLLPGASQPLFALVIAFVVFGGLDARESARGLWPRWYSRLRIQLSVAVVACLVAGALALG
jgi:hypothetical protein